MNVIAVIKPYKYQGMWVFDDEATGLVKEPFVSGADAIIDEALRIKGIKGDTGFLLTFSAESFPGYDYVFERTSKPTDTGTWYTSRELNMEGWLCPALLLYFKEAPETLYTRFNPLPKLSWLKKLLAKG